MIATTGREEKKNHTFSYMIHTCMEILNTHLMPCMACEKLQTLDEPETPDTCCIDGSRHPGRTTPNDHHALNGTAAAISVQRAGVVTQPQLLWQLSTSTILEVPPIESGKYGTACFFFFLTYIIHINASWTSD